MTTQAPSFLIGTSSFLQDTRTFIKAWMSLNFSQIQPLTTELPALERLNNQCFEHSNALIGSSPFLQVTRTIIVSDEFDHGLQS